MEVDMDMFLIAISIVDVEPLSCGCIMSVLELFAESFNTVDFLLHLCNGQLVISGHLQLLLLGMPCRTIDLT